MVLLALTFTPTVPTPVIMPTDTATPTAREIQLFNDLRECGALADKAMAESYDAGMKDGARAQLCYSQCRMYRMDLKNLKEAQAQFEQENKETNEMGTLERVLATERERHPELDPFYQEQLDKTRARIKNLDCNCAEFKLDND